MRAAFRCPSNIALVKYWGKKEGGRQLPANASVSLTLGDLYTETSVEVAHGNVSGAPAFKFFLDGAPKPGFEPKLQAFFKNIWNDLSVLREQSFIIHSTNNFPHGAGIASSAAGFGALALCICRLQEQHSGKSFDDFYQKASETARLGSGSACRSMYAEPAIWGLHEAVPDSSDLHAVPFADRLHEEFSDLKDAVLIVDAGEKAVSSTAGHALLKGNPYADARFAHANQNLNAILGCMKDGQMRRFIHIVESEALQLHAMMMASNPYYVLMRPNTLAIIEELWKFREQSGLAVMFTLDAGPNVHILYRERDETAVRGFIDDRLRGYCDKGTYLCSVTGERPSEIHAR